MELYSQGIHWMISSRDMLAYIGPGSGFAITFSLVTVVMVILGIILVVFFWPISALWHAVFRGKGRKDSKFRKVVILGLDGFDPKIAQCLMAKGRLPHFQELAQKGCFRELRPTTPSISPSVWSSMATGQDPSYHGIFDFVARSSATYRPRLSSAEIVAPRRDLRWGKFRFPLGRARVRRLQKGEPFWHKVARAGYECTILRVPITFPPSPFPGRLLSGMCVPDVLGTQGTYTVFSTKDRSAECENGQYVKLTFQGCTARTMIQGPENPYRTDGRRLTIPFRIKIVSTRTVKIRIQKKTYRLTLDRYSPWLHIPFQAGPDKIAGIARFCLRSLWPHVTLYMTAIHLSPARPALPISHPTCFASYLEKHQGPYGTLGLIEDTNALNEGVLDEKLFIAQAAETFRERKNMLLHALRQKANDLVFAVFDTSDRIQHMFWRQKEESSKSTGSQSNVIDRMYGQMDTLLSETLKALPADALLLVVSDHGFTGFRRGVNLNTWLLENGYLALHPDADPNAKWLEAVDWSRTRAYAVGLTGIYLNVKGRERLGIVDPSEFDSLAGELKTKLLALSDVDCPWSFGSQKTFPIRRVLVTRKAFSGPYRHEGPDLLACFHEGYRCSWGCAKGQVEKTVFSENTQHWNGDHCVDPELVPGVLFSNVRFPRSDASVLDIAPTVLDAFGLTNPSLQGASLLQEENPKRNVAKELVA